MSSTPQDERFISHKSINSRGHETLTPQQRFYYPELDSIRLFLFFSVWGYHALPHEQSVYVACHIPVTIASWITGVIAAGMCSLDVFFILSAFLITELLLRERELHGTADLKMFYIRRLLRIWPLYFFVIALAAALSVVDRSQLLGWRYALGFLLFAGNWIIVFDGYPRASMIGPLWSVCFEEQFYLLWPLVLRRASKVTAYGIVLALMLLATSVRIVLLLNHADGGSLWFNTLVRLDSIACGILLALFLHQRPTPHFGRHLRVALLSLGFGAWFIVGRYCGLHNAVPPLAGGMLGYPLMSIAGGVIFLAILGAGDDGLAFLKHPGLVYLGKISYGLYAFHMLALRCAYFLFRGHDHLFTLSLICALTITIVLAIVSFEWLETPFLRLKQKKYTYVPSGPPVAPSHESAPPEFEERSEFLDGDAERLLSPAIAAEAASTTKTCSLPGNLASSQPIES